MKNSMYYELSKLMFSQQNDLYDQLCPLFKRRVYFEMNYEPTLQLLNELSFKFYKEFEE